MSGPLAGVVVVDLTTIVMGPYASQMLADLGARVTKVEAPGGDAMRHVGPKRHPGMGPNFLQLNRGKRSEQLDLKTPAGLSRMMELLAVADVFLHSLRPHTLAGLGLDYERVRAVNPRIIHCGCFGYGQGGPYAARPAYDDLIQGACGIPDLVRRAGGGEPRYTPLNLADRTVGLYTAMAINAALYERERSGEGQSVEVPMFETMSQFVLGDHLWGMTHEPPLAGTGYVRLLSPQRRPFRTLDGHVCVLIYSDRQWRSFAQLVGDPGLLERDERFADAEARTVHVDHVQGFVARHLVADTTARWLERLEAADIPVTPMNSLEALLDDPHLAATGFFARVEHPTEGTLRLPRVPARFSRTPAADPGPAPRLGEHDAWRET